MQRCRCDAKRECSGEVLQEDIREDAPNEGRCLSSSLSEDSCCDLSALLASAAGLRSHREQQRRRLQQQQQGEQEPHSPSAASTGSAQTCGHSPFAAVGGPGFSRVASVPSSMQPRARSSFCACSTPYLGALGHGAILLGVHAAFPALCFGKESAIALCVCLSGRCSEKQACCTGAPAHWAHGRRRTRGTGTA